MTIGLAILRERLELDVPARDGVPGASQCERAVRLAVEDYGRRKPMRKLATLSIVSGTATYNLPDDFLKVIQLGSLTAPSGILFSAEGLIPVSASYEERYYIVGGQITFDPTPAYTVARDLWYLATYVLDADNVYQDLTEADAGIVLLKARALAMGMQAEAVAGDIQAYQVGDMRVEKGKTVESLRASSKSLEGQYLAAVAAAIGVVGMRAGYLDIGY